MNIKTLILSFLLTHPISGIAQTKIDDNISIRFPGEPHERDLSEQNAVAFAYYLNSPTESYLLLRMAIAAEEEDANTLPQGLSGLDYHYHRIMIDQIKAMGRQGFAFKDSSKTTIDKYIGYRIIYIDAGSGNQNAESLILFLNGVNYVATYSKVDTFNVENKTRFLSSIQISDSSTIEQMQVSVADQASKIL